MEVFPFTQDAGVIERLERALDGESPSSIEFPYVVPDTGKSGWARDTSAPFRNLKGAIIGVIGTVEDITERKLYTQQPGIFIQSGDSILIKEQSVIYPNDHYLEVNYVCL